MNLEHILKTNTAEMLKKVYGVGLNSEFIQIQKTRKEFEGDYTINVFPFLKKIKKPPVLLANEIGDYLQSNLDIVSSFNIIKGFLNISISTKFWLVYLNNLSKEKNLKLDVDNNLKQNILIEYSSPNTNKPLHLGHVRNNLLGDSISRILKVAGHNVTKVNLVNDRGIHICKSMLAWQKWGKGITPEKVNLKGDKLVGDYYVKFDKEYKKQVVELKASGKTQQEAEKEAPLIIEAQRMLQKWESGDKEIVDLWKKMNNWVYAGFKQTYKTLGISFDKTYYESDTYKLGKKIVLDGLKRKVFFQKEDKSIWTDLSENNIDEKLLLRSDGTSVYITQDIGTAHRRFTEHKIDMHIYVVGNEQNHHFKVLKLVLKKLGYEWADDIFHLSYGMVELPAGKMKSREGTVVDADDLIENMILTARETADELGKLEELSDLQKEEIYKTIAIGALKYFILRVDPKKSMLFNPQESIDFNGNTGPFIQYTFARIKSIELKAKEQNIEAKINLEENLINKEEIKLIKILYDYRETIKNAAKNFSPAIIANYSYELAKEFNKFYHDFPIIKEQNKDIRNLRIIISSQVAKTIKTTMQLLGANVPTKM